MFINVNNLSVGLRWTPATLPSCMHLGLTHESSLQLKFMGIQSPRLSTVTHGNVHRGYLAGTRLYTICECISSTYQSELYLVAVSGVHRSPAYNDTWMEFQSRAGYPGSWNFLIDRRWTSSGPWTVDEKFILKLTTELNRLRLYEIAKFNVPRCHYTQAKYSNVSQPLSFAELWRHRLPLASLLLISQGTSCNLCISLICHELLCNCDIDFLNRESVDEYLLLSIIITSFDLIPFYELLQHWGKWVLLNLSLRFR